MPVTGLRWTVSQLLITEPWMWKSLSMSTFSITTVSYGNSSEWSGCLLQNRREVEKTLWPETGFCLGLVCQDLKIACNSQEELKIFQWTLLRTVYMLLVNEMENTGMLTFTSLTAHVVMFPICVRLHCHQMSH